MKNAFITGSQVYGTPHDKSDVDLVVLLPAEVIVMLNKHSENPWTVRFGKINILAFDQERPDEVEFFNKWKAVTDSLIARAPVTREQAIQARIDAGIGSLPKGMYEEQ